MRQEMEAHVKITVINVSVDTLDSIDAESLDRSRPLEMQSLRSENTHQRMIIILGNIGYILPGLEAVDTFTKVAAASPTVVDNNHFLRY